jgi:hypothetical protein
MPRYYFDLVDDETVYDKKGVTLPNMKAAEEYAATFARELMETKPTLMGEGGNRGRSRSATANSNGYSRSRFPRSRAWAAAPAMMRPSRSRMRGR